jgi:hypothetical protein
MTRIYIPTHKHAHSYPAPTQTPTHTQIHIHKHTHTHTHTHSLTHTHTAKGCGAGRGAVYNKQHSGTGMPMVIGLFYRHIGPLSSVDRPLSRPYRSLFPYEQVAFDTCACLKAARAVCHVCKRGLFSWQKRPMYMAKEAYSHRRPQGWESRLPCLLPSVQRE